MPDVTDMAHRYSSAWDESDVIFTIDGSEFHCHHVVLKLNSPVFRTLFCDKDGNSMKEKKLDLSGKEPESFRIFLDYMYPMPPGYEGTTDRAVLDKVLEYCKEYQTDSVKLQIDYVLFSKVYSVEGVELSIPVVMKDLLTSEQHELSQTRKVSLDRLVKISYDLDVNSYEGTVYPDLSVETKFEILTSLLRICFSSAFITKGYNTNKLLDSISKQAHGIPMTNTNFTFG